MNGRIAPWVWGPAGGVVTLPAIFFGVPAPNWSSARRTFGSSASPRGRNASLLRCFLADDRAPRLPNTIGDALLPRPDFACATRDCGSTRSRRVIPGRPVRGVARTTPETSRLGAPPPPGAPVYLSNFGPEVIQTPSKPPLRRPSRLSPTLFSAQLRQPAHPIHPVKRLRDDQGRGREAAHPRPPAPLVDGRERLFLCRDSLRAVSWFFTPNPQVPDQRGVVSRETHVQGQKKTLGRSQPAAPAGSAPHPAGGGIAIGLHPRVLP